jgi:hypothetical protein
MAHKSLKIKQFEFPDPPFLNPDQISYTISRLDLENKTLKVKRLSRAAIFYLTFAMSQSELEKSKTIEKSKTHHIFSAYIPMNIRFES